MEVKSMELVRPCYAAKPLLRGEQTIRLVTFDRTESGAIHAELIVVDLTDSLTIPSWTALSYTWASNYGSFRNLSGRVYRTKGQSGSCVEPDQHQILLGGYEYVVGHNLWLAMNALIDLREADHLRSVGMQDSQSAFECFGETAPARFWKYFWIDAICIDQSTVLERNHQVRMMKQIFSKATVVVAWLAPVIGKQVMTGSDLVNNPFWSRIWIIQEVVLAQQLVILTENARCLSAQEYFKLYKWMFEDSVDGRDDTRVLDLRHSYRHIREAELLGRDNSDINDGLEWRRGVLGIRPDLPDLLNIFSRSECQDSRDRVYGLLGILPDDYPIKADYSLSAHELFMDLVHVERNDLTDAEQWRQALALSNVDSKMSPFTYRLRFKGLDVASPLSSFADLDEYSDQALLRSLYVAYYEAKYDEGELDFETIQVMRKTLAPKEFMYWLREAIGGSIGELTNGELTNDELLEMPMRRPGLITRFG